MGECHTGNLNWTPQCRHLRPGRCPASLAGSLSKTRQINWANQNDMAALLAWDLGVATACRAGHWQMLDWQLELGTGSWGLVYAQQGITAQAGVSGQGISDCLCINLKIVTNIWKLKLTECSCFVVAHKIACTMKITEFMGWMIWLHVEFIQVNSILKPDSGVANINFYHFWQEFFCEVLLKPINWYEPVSLPFTNPQHPLTSLCLHVYIYWTSGHF